MAPFGFIIKDTKQANDSDSRVENVIARQYEHSQMRLVREGEDLHPQTPQMLLQVLTYQTSEWLCIMQYDCHDCYVNTQI